METTKIAAIVAECQDFDSSFTTDTIEDFINADWPEGQEHLDWLESATAHEIADWVIAGLK